MNKRIVTAFLAALLLVSLVGCVAQPDHDRDADTTVDPHEGHSHTTTGDGASIPTKFDEVVSVTESPKIPNNAKVYRDPSAREVNYTLQLTAESDLVAVQLFSIAPDTAQPDTVLCSLSPLNKGESQYLQLYVNDAAADRGIVCTDTQGKRWYYALVYSGDSGRVTLGYFHPHA